MTSRVRRPAAMAALYASYGLTLVLSLVLFVTVVFFLVPPVMNADVPPLRVIAVSLITPVLMVLCALAGFFPAAWRTVQGQATDELTDAFAGAGRAYTGCLAIVVGFSLASLVATLPLIAVRLLFFH